MTFMRLKTYLMQNDLVSCTKRWRLPGTKDAFEFVLPAIRRLLSGDCVLGRHQPHLLEAVYLDQFKKNPRGSL